MKITDYSIRNIAKTGLQNMSRLQRDDQIKMGDMYLGTIENTGTKLEKQLARLTRQATSIKKKPLSSRWEIVAIQKFALKALADGATGSVSKVLASIAADIMSSKEPDENSSCLVVSPEALFSVGSTFLASIGKSGQDEERILANVAYTTSHMDMEYDDSIVIQKTALNMLKDEYPYKNDPAGALIEFARKATENIKASVGAEAHPETIASTTKDIMTLNEFVLDYLQKDTSN